MGQAGWQQLLREVGPGYLDWLGSEGALENRTRELAEALSGFLVAQISDRGQALAVIESVPGVLGRCNEQSTYEMPGAAHAYMWLHFLDRYVRTWRALEVAVSGLCLPLGTRGVDALDVGAGPGSAGMAVSDFYRRMSEYGAEIGEPRLEQRACVTCFEASHPTNQLRHQFVESLNDHIELAHAMPDFASFDAAAWRASHERRLRDDEYFDETTGYCERTYSNSEVNDEVQALHRYKLVVFSNFLTTVGFAGEMEPALSAILADLRAGAAVMVLGAGGGEYPQIYAFVDRIAGDAGLKVYVADQVVCAEGRSEQELIYAAGLRVYNHLSVHTYVSGLPDSVRKHFADLRPWNSRSRLRVYRRD